MSKSSELIQEIEVNDKQADFLEALFYCLTADGVKKAGMIGGIGSGKTVAMSVLMLASKEELPRAKGQFACCTVTQFLRSIWPGIKAIWSEFFGLKQYNFTTREGDFIFGRRPPEDWDRPYQEPDNWDNCITFPNGWVMEVCGYKINADLHRGRNDDFSFMDEALLFKQEWLKILEGRIRSNKGKFDSPLHWLIAFFSSPPYGNTGEWMFGIEDLARDEPDRYLFTQVTTKDNLAFLPSNYVENLSKTLTRLEIEVEVEGKRLSKMPNCFYPSLDWDRATDIDEDTYYNPDQPVTAVVDFNALFTSCTLWQDQGYTQMCVLNDFVKDPDHDKNMAQSLAASLLERLSTHRCRTIYITGDRNGLNASASQKKKNDGTWQTVFDDFADEFLAAGWNIILCPLSYNPLKDEIHRLMQKVLADKHPDFNMRFHKVFAKSTLISMQRTPVTATYGKDKASETKKGEDQERATHLSDTVDYYAAFKALGGAMPTGGGFDISFH